MGEAAAGPGQPQGQQRGEAGQPRIAGGLPNGRQDGDDVRGRGQRLAATRLLRGAVGAVEQGDGMLAMIAGRGAELIHDARLRMPWSQGIARAEGAHIRVGPLGSPGPPGA